MDEPTWEETNWSPEARQALITALDGLSEKQLRDAIKFALKDSDKPLWFHITLVAALKAHIEMNQEGLQ